MRIKKNFRHCILLILMALAVLSSVSALDVKWNWTGDHGDIGYFRYQLNGEDEDGWTVVDGKVMQAVTPDVIPEEENIFYLQSSYDGEVWSASAQMKYSPEKVVNRKIVKTDVKKLGIRTVASPYTLGIIDFYNGHDIEGSNTFMTTAYGASCDEEFFFDIFKNISIYFNAGYSVIDKPTTVLPDAFVLQYVRLVAGEDVVFPIKDFCRVGFGTSVGTLFHFNERFWNCSTVAGGRLFAEFNITDRFLLGASSRFWISYLGNDDPLMKSLTWIIDPLALTVTYRF